MGYIDNFTGKVWDWTKPFQRTGKFPLDRSSMFASYEDALLYAKGDGSDSRGLGATSYIGQTITVWGPNEKGIEGVWVYSLIPTEKEGFAAELKTVGAGSATESATNYTAAKVLSNDLVVGQLIKVENEETIGEETYQKGFYIVEGAGVISALATSTGSDDEVGALKTRVAAVETGKVDKVEGSRLMTDAEGTKLAGIAEGAEVNYVKSVGDNLAVDADGRLTVNMTSKVNKSDYDTKIGEIEAALVGKADSQTVANHIADANIHVSLDEKAVWNNAEKNAKDYADTLNTAMDGRMTAVEGDIATLKEIDHDAYIAADEVLESKLQSNIDAKADVSALENYLLKSEKYDDTEVRGLISAETEARGELATTLRGEIEDAQTAAEKVATDYNTAMDGRMTTVEDKVADLEAINHEQLMADAINEWANQVSPDNTTVDTFKELIDYAATHSSEYSELAGVVQGLTNNKADKTALEALNAIVGKASVDGGEDGSGLVKRVEDLEAIDHDAYKSADATLKSELQVEIGKKADASALNTEISAREALAALVGTRAEGDNEDVFTKLAVLVEKNGSQDEEISKKAAQSDLEALSDVVDTKAAQSDLDTLAGVVGKESEESGIFAKLKALASKDSEHDNAIAALQALKVNNKTFEDGAVVLDAGDIALETAIMSDNGEGSKVEQYPVSSSIQSVLQSLNNRITAAVSGGLTSIAAGDGIAVTDVIGNSQTVSIKVSSAENNAVKINTDGIFVEYVTFGGNDAEI